jgi:hypothetical protein
MQLKRCEHCNDIFSAQKTGVTAFLCRPCAMDCEIAYFKVLKLLREEEAQNRSLAITDLHWISEKTGVVPVFIRVLYETGRFSTEEEAADPERPCKSCRQVLKAHEKEFCAKCALQLTHAIRETRPDNNAISKKTAPLPQPEGSAGRLPPHPDSEPEHRYGLGR